MKYAEPIKLRLNKQCWRQNNQIENEKKEEQVSLNCGHF